MKRQSKLGINYFFSICLIFVFFLLLRCSTYHSAVTSNKNFAYLYNPVSSSLHSQFYVFSPSDTKSEIFIRIPRKEILFSTKNNETKPKAFLSVQYRVKHMVTNSFVLDSGSLIMDIPDTNKLFVEFPIWVNTVTYKRFFVSLKIKDISSGNDEETFLTIDKTSANSAENFMVFDQNENLLYDYITTQGKQIRVQYRYPQIKQYFIKWYAQPFDIAKVPYSTTSDVLPDFIEDTLFVVNAQEPIIFTKPGLYFIQTDTLQKEGLPIYCFGKDFPNTKTPSDMLGPLRYLTSKKEYLQYLGYQNKKLAIDEFWLKAGGNIPRGKALIKIFYNRVLLANIYFSSFKEGWKTDRGMIYIIFGKPKYVFKAPDVEKWIYGDLQDPNSLSFVFNRIVNPFSTNYFVLKRLDFYSSIWNQAVYTWRDGRAYTVGY